MVGEPIERWLEAQITAAHPQDDPAHDLLHLKRVVRSAKALCAAERAIPEVVIPAVWLHDLAPIPKNDSRRTEASRLSARAAMELLRRMDYPAQFLDAIRHAIEAHSFSAGIAPVTTEAKVVQDADRLDGLGAIGIARCFATAGRMGRVLYREEDPFCTGRAPDDGRYTMDHFFQKLFATADMLQTETGRAEGRRRVETMRQYLAALKAEI